MFTNEVVNNAGKREKGGVITCPIDGEKRYTGRRTGYLRLHD